MPGIAAVILAAGGSSRFGGIKQLVEFAGSTLIERSVSAAVNAGCSPVILVTGWESVRVAAAVHTTNATIVENEHWRCGIGSSIRAGLRCVVERSPQPNGVALLVSDQPFVNQQLIAELINHWGTSGKVIAASRYANTLGVPAVFGRSCFDELLQLDNDSGAKSIILRDADRVTSVPFPKGECDIDTAEDLARLMAHRGFAEE